MVLERLSNLERFANAHFWVTCAPPAAWRSSAVHHREPTDERTISEPDAIASGADVPGPEPKRWSGPGAQLAEADDLSVGIKSATERHVRMRWMILRGLI